MPVLREGRLIFSYPGGVDGNGVAGVWQQVDSELFRDIAGGGNFICIGTQRVLLSLWRELDFFQCVKSKSLNKAPFNLRK